MKNLFLLPVFLLFLGTTFIIKEGGVEVGRWSEDDGNDVIEVIANDAPATNPPAKLKDPTPTDSDSGYAWTEPERPEGDIATWRVSGQVVDIITARGIPSGGHVVFSYGSEVVKLPIKADGFFRGRLPRFEKGGYYVTVEGVDKNYDTRVELMKTGSFSKVPYKERLRRRGTIQFGSLSDMTVRENLFEMQVGLMPNVLSPKDEKAYRSLYS